MVGKRKPLKAKMTVLANLDQLQAFALPRTISLTVSGNDAGLTKCVRLFRYFPDKVGQEKISDNGTSQEKYFELRNRLTDTFWCSII